MRWLLTGLMVMLAVQVGAQIRIHRVLPDPVGNENRNDTPEIIEVRMEQSTFISCGSCISWLGKNGGSIQRLR